MLLPCPIDCDDRVQGSAQPAGLYPAPSPSLSYEVRINFDMVNCSHRGKRKKAQASSFLCYCTIIFLNYSLRNF